MLNWLKGVPFYHLWYMYMLVGLYLFAPVLILLKHQIGDKFFERAAWGLLLLSGMFAWGGGMSLLIGIQDIALITLDILWWVMF